MEIMKKIILDLILIILFPFMLGGIIFLVSFHFFLYNELGHPDFGFMLIKLMLLDLFYVAYLTLFYKRRKSEDGFNQTKEFIINRKIIFSIIKVIDWILARLFIFIIPILILCIGITFIDFIYTWITSIYGRGYGNLTIGKTAMKIASLCMFYPLIYLWRFLIKKVLRL